MADPQDSPVEAVPGTPGIREVRSETGAETFGFCTQACLGTGVDPNPGIRRVSLRAEIDTSPPFGSVEEAVTRFGGRGSWVPFYKFGNSYEFDIKKVEEEATELEKDLIVKELETLDVLEELGTTKRIVEELKRQLQQEALKCMRTPISNPDEVMAAPEIKEMNKDHYEQQIMGSLSPCPLSSPDLILMELKQAKMNLGKTMNDLGVIQSSVESLTKKMKKEKSLLEKTRERLTSKFAGAASLEEELKQMKGNPNPQISNGGSDANQDLNSTRPPMQPLKLNYNQAGQIKTIVDPARFEIPRAVVGNEQGKSCMYTAEMRLVAAKKMEEAARAAEALALAEMKALSSSDIKLSKFSLPEPEQSPRTPRFLNTEEVSDKKVMHPMQKFPEAKVSQFSILKKLEEASEEFQHSKHALEEALSRVEIANRKQLAAEEALRRWVPDYEQRGQATYNAIKASNFHPSNYHHSRSPLHEMNRPNMVNSDPKPVLKPTVSMRDILSRKQVLPEDCVIKRQNEGQNERQKVALSQMLHELREDLTFPPKNEKESDDQKQFYTQRRKFGFVHISLPLPKQIKKKALNRT